MQKESQQKYISITLTRIKEILIYINTFWHKKDQVELQPIETTKSFSNGEWKLKGQVYMIANSKMYLAPELKHSANEQTVKLKNVDLLLHFIDTDLEEITKNIQRIYENISVYEDSNDFICSDKKQRKGKPQQSTSNKIRSKEVDIFGNIFKYINQCLFTDMFKDILNKSPQQLTIMLLSIETKLSILPNMIDSASKFKSDITTSHPFTQIYSHAWQNIHFIDMDDMKDRIREQICRLKKMMKITTSAVVNEITSLDVELVRKVVFGLSFPYYWVADEESQLKCYKIWRNPKIQNLNQVWNLPQNGAIKHCKKIIFPSIKTNLFIYLPSDFKDFKKQIKNKQVDYLPQIFQYPQNPSDYIRVSVLYYGRLNFNPRFQKHQPFYLFPCINIPNEEDLDTIIIHFHGGGFVALSSETTQSYTRKWANELKVPVFSVDYRKPPGYRFPIPLEDCLTAYEFIVENIHKYFKIRPRQIILAGDSAGGNLAVSLQALLMQKNYPLQPSGMFLAYPAVDLRVKYTPSRLNSFDDPILIPPLLFLCLRQYLGQNEKNQQNPLASPILLSEDFIRKGSANQISSEQGKWPKQWPQTTVMVGKRDPLYDDSLRLVEKMSKSGVKVKMLIYNQFSHAFLSLDAMIPICSRAIDDSIVEIRKLINF